MQVNPLPVPRDASRDFVALDRPFHDGRVQTANIAVGASNVSPNIVDNPNLHVQGKTTVVYLAFQT